MRFDFYFHTAHTRAETDRIMAALDALRQEVQETRTISQSAITLLQGLKQKLDDAIASGDMSQVQALADDLDASNRELADAVTANTPAETEPTNPVDPAQPV